MVIIFPCSISFFRTSFTLASSLSARSFTVMPSASVMALVTGGGAMATGAAARSVGPAGLTPAARRDAGPADDSHRADRVADRQACLPGRDGMPGRTAYPG